jgi:hypothetical protein
VTVRSALDLLVGRWSTVAWGGVFGDERFAGRTTFTWTLDGAALLQEATVDHPQAPSVHAVVVPDGDGFLQHYFDSRGVVRLYRMALDGTTWTLQRDAPDFSELPFHQRYVATLDGDVIDGRWERSDDGAAWVLDFHLRHERT